MNQPNPIKTGIVVRLAQQGNPDIFVDGRENRFTVAGSEQANGLTFYRLREVDGLFLADSFAWELCPPNLATESAEQSQPLQRPEPDFDPPDKPSKP
jgi:hypothetical protein